MLPTRSEIDGLTVDKAASIAYPAITYDCALPQMIVDDLIANGFDPRGKCVTTYRSGCFGTVEALCVEWKLDLERAQARSVYGDDLGELRGAVLIQIEKLSTFARGTNDRDALRLLIDNLSLLSYQHDRVGKANR